MSTCLRCGADSSWIRGHVPAMPRDAEIERLRGRVEDLESLLREAVEDIEGWAGYASAYFQDKHDLPGRLARYRAALAQQEGEG